MLLFEVLGHNWPPLMVTTGRTLPSNMDFSSSEQVSRPAYSHSPQALFGTFRRSVNESPSSDLLSISVFILCLTAVSLCLWTDSGAGGWYAASLRTVGVPACETAGHLPKSLEQESSSVQSHFAACWYSLQSLPSSANRFRINHYSNLLLPSNCPSRSKVYPASQSNNNDQVLVASSSILLLVADQTAYMSHVWLPSISTFSVVPSQ